MGVCSLENAAEIQGALAPAREQHPQGVHDPAVIQESTHVTRLLRPLGRPGLHARGWSAGLCFSGWLPAPACAVPAKQVTPERKRPGLCRHGCQQGAALQPGRWCGDSPGTAARRREAGREPGPGKRADLRLACLAYSARYRRSHSSSRVLSGRVALPRRYQ